LPCLPLGASDEHASFPGTLSLSDETLNSMWYEVCVCVHRAGLRRIIIINGHGGTVWPPRVSGRILACSSEGRLPLADASARPAAGALRTDTERGDSMPEASL